MSNICPEHRRAEVVSCLGSLVQSCCGEGGALQTNVAGMCGEHSQCSGHTRFAPTHGWRVCFPHLHRSSSRLLYRKQSQVACGSNFRVLHKSADSFGPAFCAFPGRSNSGSQELESALSVGALSPMRSQPQFLHALLWCVRLVSVLGSWSLAVTLPADVNHPESQKVFD